MAVFDIARKALLAGLGMEGAVKTFIDELVKKGDLNGAEGARLLEEWMRKAEESSRDLEQKVSEKVNKVLGQMNLPSRDDIARLESRIENLSRLLTEASLRK